MGFNRDLSNGQKCEILLKKILERAGVEASLSEDRKVDLIIKIGKKNYTIENKWDLYAEKSGNLAFEFFNSKSNQPSGIAETTANLWVQVIPDCGLNTMWITSVKRLRNYIKNHTPLKTVLNAGDNNANIHLYRIYPILDDIFKRIDNISSDEVIKVLKELIKDK